MTEIANRVFVKSGTAVRLIVEIEDEVAKGTITLDDFQNLNVKVDPPGMIDELSAPVLLGSILRQLGNALPKNPEGV